MTGGAVSRAGVRLRRPPRSRTKAAASPRRNRAKHGDLPGSVDLQASQQAPETREGLARVSYVTSLERSIDWDDDELKTVPPLDLDDTEADLASAAYIPSFGGDYKFSKSTLAWLEDEEGFELLFDFYRLSELAFPSGSSDRRATCGRARPRAERLLARRVPLSPAGTTPRRKLSTDGLAACFAVADNPHLEVRADGDRIALRLESARARLRLQLESAVAITLHDIFVGAWRHWDPHESGAHAAPNRIATCPWCVFWLYDGQAA